ncbi:Glyceraldehyde-3-phosphate dehydrogenase [Gulosibacter molinativorax]|nr:Glyceraldehyde-3-phosphate dehydrogenase [Gulosibacter molinativorax]
MTDLHAQSQADWFDRVETAEKMIPLISKLYRERNIVTSIHGRRLINRSAIEVIKAHRAARRNHGQDLELEQSIAILEVLGDLSIETASVDIATLAYLYSQEAEGTDLTEFIKDQLKEVGPVETTNKSANVVLYGFGRIGRLLARILIDQASTGPGLRLRAIVVRKNGEDDIEKRASLLRRDSVHGPFNGTIKVDKENNTILANGTLIQVIYSNDPTTVDYTAYGIDDAIVVDNTGRWRDEAGLSQHLQAKGTSRVLLTAPGKGSIPNIVFGINQDVITDETKILSAASCTTNGITPVLAALDRKYGVKHGHVETVHSFTNDQNLIDNFHKGARRGRAATLNMVLTETGAAKAVSKALPQFEGKLTGNAIRVPTRMSRWPCSTSSSSRMSRVRTSTTTSATSRCTRTCASRSTTLSRPTSSRPTSWATTVPVSSTVSLPSPPVTASSSMSGTTTSSATRSRSFARSSTSVGYTRSSCRFVAR